MEDLVKSIQVRLSKYLGKALLRIDFRAAFQNLFGHKALEVVARFAPSLEQSCRSWYDGRATHVIWDENGVCNELLTGRGVDQGCPLGAFLFAVTMTQNY